MLIYHLISANDWAGVLESGQYTPPSYATEGFIHFSTEAQLLETARRFYNDAQELVVLEVSEKMVKSALKWEPAEDKTLFPHVYAPLTVDQISDTHMIYKDAKGEWVWV